MRVTEAQQRVLGLLNGGGACIQRGRYVEYGSQQICKLDTVQSLAAKGLLMRLYLPEPEDKYARWMISDEGQKWIDDKRAFDKLKMQRWVELMDKLFGDLKEAVHAEIRLQEKLTPKALSRLSEQKGQQVGVEIANGLVRS